MEGQQVERFSGVRIYAAGKIVQNGWRTSLFPVTDWAQYEDPSLRIWPDAVPIRSLPGGVYVGPHFLSDDHGCFHGTNAHGVAAGSAACGGAYPGLPREEVVKRCLAAIEDCTHIFAWIDEPTAYGSLAEIGYARALGKRIYLYLPAGVQALDDLWFAMQMAELTSRVADVDAAWNDFTDRLTRSGSDAWYRPTKIRLP
ncbi:hypothetical protein OWR29_26520 [Actinoplanes sp. Pm04-4]|uniref:Nucleoside 2-deoxyribosyltransferase n=1 Tax=Paractinoplanes pyxinae TaxID=2997416 RepID=A0ABT4B7I2_9ACTN|nr:hypothetical protein [Actinoplanes pyxinae]MCY1141568.1 hypothetical protein [Actinoplanes pyxinae]